MRRRTEVAIAVCLLAGSVFPLSAQQRQPPATTSGQDQADLLRKGTDNLYDKKLTPVEAGVRDDVMQVRDSVDVAAGFAERLSRAAGNNTQSVMLSAAKSLEPACAAAARTVARIRPHFTALRLTVSDRGLQQQSEKILKDYRAALDTLSALMTNCSRDITAGLRGGKPNSAALGKTATALNVGVVSYEAHLRVMLNQFDIPLRPKQQPKGG